MYQRILVAIDGSSTGDRALREAIRFAQDQHAQLRGIHVLEDIPAMYIGLADGVDLAALDASVRQAGQEALDRAVAAAQQAGVQMEAALLLPERRPVGEVLVAAARAWSADLIVMGTHGRQGLAHLLLGSVAETVVRQAPTPILLIRGD